jgi:opacity protein-like surface antigen
MRTVAVLAMSLLLQGARSSAEDERAQYPPYLANSYFDVGIAYIDYPFSERQLEPGFQAGAIEIPRVGGRLVLLGHRFTERLAAQFVYMRPAQWVKYDDVNGVPGARSVWMNIGGLTVRGTAPLGGPLSIDAEAGVGVVTRHGFLVDGVPAVKDASYWTLLLGGGLRYRLNESWDLGANATYSPSNAKVRQPHTLVLSAGFSRTLRPLSEERVREDSQSGFVFPRNLLQLGYSTDFAGFRVNSLRN